MASLDAKTGNTPPFFAGDGKVLIHVFHETLYGIK
jgi:hypothetical protein|tara:strand:- start:1470 stop:1574 length:105 start_codon:yes stop_codon:yes gene_type:complete